MRRILLILTVAALAGALAASASQLNVTAEPMQAGTATVTCDPDGVNVAWILETNTGVEGVRVEGIHPDCTGATLYVDVILTGGGGPELDTEISGTEETFNLASIDPVDIQSVNVFIGG